MQHLVKELKIEMKAFDVDGKDEHYDAAAVKLERLWTLIKKSREYLTAKLESDDTQLDDSQLDDIVAYLKLYPNSNALQISEELGIHPYEIIKFMDEGWLNTVNGKFSRLED